jgi:tRNA 5-methylaminomethyl-2-thiouridine biosynthesis bifunctional protein
MSAQPDIEFYKSNYHDLHQGKQWKKYPPTSYQNGLFILGGLGSHGLTTSGLCAKTLSDLLQNTLDSLQQKILLQNCHPARYLIKDLKRNKANDYKKI